MGHASAAKVPARGPLTASPVVEQALTTELAIAVTEPELLYFPLHPVQAVQVVEGFAPTSAIVAMESGRSHQVRRSAKNAAVMAPIRQRATSATAAAISK